MKVFEGPNNKIWEDGYMTACMDVRKAINVRAVELNALIDKVKANHKMEELIECQNILTRLIDDSDLRFENLSKEV